VNQTLALQVRHPVGNLQGNRGRFKKGKDSSINMSLEVGGVISVKS
jgi:hypothetical protein